MSFGKFYCRSSQAHTSVRESLKMADSSHGTLFVNKEHIWNATSVGQ